MYKIAKLKTVNISKRNVKVSKLMEEYNMYVY